MREGVEERLTIEYSLSPVGQWVKSPDFQSGETGSSPVQAAN